MRAAPETATSPAQDRLTAAWKNSLIRRSSASTSDELRLKAVPIGVRRGREQLDRAPQ